MNTLLRDQFNTLVGLENQYRETLSRMADRSTDAAVRSEIEVAIHRTTRHLERLGLAIASFDSVLDVGSCRCGKCLSAITRVGSGADADRRLRDVVAAAI